MRRVTIGQIAWTENLKGLTSLHLAGCDFPALGHTVHSHLEYRWLFSFEVARILELIPSVCKGLKVYCNPIEWLALSATFFRNLLFHYLNALHVLLNFVNTMIDVVVIIIENIVNFSLILRLRHIMEFLECLCMSL